MRLSKSIFFVILFAGITKTYSQFTFALHKFFAAAEMLNESTKDLGYEIDLVTSHQLNNFVGVQFGYSQYISSNGVETVKNNFDGNSNYWAWAMLTIDPVFFSWQKQDIQLNNQQQ